MNSPNSPNSQNSQKNVTDVSTIVVGLIGLAVGYFIWLLFYIIFFDASPGSSRTVGTGAILLTAPLVGISLICLGLLIVGQGLAAIWLLAFAPIVGIVNGFVGAALIGDLKGLAETAVASGIALAWLALGGYVLFRSSNKSDAAIDRVS